MHNIKWLLEALLLLSLEE